MTLVERVQARLVVEGGHGRQRIAQLVREEGPLLTTEGESAAVEAVLAAVEGLGALEPLIADDSISDVLVNGDGLVWVESAGRLSPTGLRLSRSQVELLIERIVAPLGLRVDRSSPIVDARLPDGSRVHAVVPPVAVDGPCLTLRRFGNRPRPLVSFAAPSVVRLLTAAVGAGANLLISGGTGGGKTTLLNALAAVIPKGQRIVTVEDAAELRLPQEHVVRLETRPPNSEGAGEIPARTLVRTALRMRPDRIIVGECRGGEALDVLQAMNTGHDGSMTTCHANSCEDALRRLETMVLFADAGLPLAAVREHLASAVDLVVQVARRPNGGSRRVVGVAEVETESRAGRPRVRLLADGDGIIAAPQRPRLTASP